jgi:hypothetical protein
MPPPLPLGTVIGEPGKEPAVKEANPKNVGVLCHLQIQLTLFGYSQRISRLWPYIKKDIFDLKQVQVSEPFKCNRVVFLA